MLMKHEVPEVNKTAFNCPHCGAYAKMDWTRLIYFMSNRHLDSSMWVSKCAHCQQLAYWLGQPKPSEKDIILKGQMVVPSTTQAPLPHFDMPASVKTVYEEAREVASASPRAAAALLRLAVQQLCIELGEKGNNINDDIANLVKNGLPSQIQKALDILRVVGNNAVHPRELQPDDIMEIAVSLFELVNQIVEETITKPKKMEEIFDRLPKGARDAIEQRDS